MACCVGAKYGSWCKDEDIVYVDKEKNEYCIFHAPAEHKYKKINSNELIESDQLKKLIIHRIAQHKKNEFKIDLCNFEGTVFHELLFFRKKDIPSDTALCFSNCSFKQRFVLDKDLTINKLDISECTFNDSIDIACSPKKGISISYTDVNNIIFLFKSKTISHLSIYKSSINGIVLAGVTFNGEVAIKESNITDSFIAGTGYLNAKPAIFNHELKITDVKFNDYCKLDECTFNSNVTILDTSFKKLINLSKSTSQESFIICRCQFEKHIFCTGSNFKYTYIELSSFNSNAYFNKLTCETFEVMSCYFDKNCTFNGSKFSQKIKLSEVDFNKYAFLRKITVGEVVELPFSSSNKSIVISDLAIQKLSFDNTNIESFKLLGYGLHLDEVNKMYDEINSDKYDELAEIFRRLKKESQNNTDEIQTSAWHYKEKEMQKKHINSVTPIPDKITYIIIISLISSLSILYSNNINLLLPSIICLLFSFVYTSARITDFKNSKRWFEKIYLNAYYTISGYGERPLKAFFFLLGIIGTSMLTAITLDPITTQSEPSLQLSFLKQWLWYIPLTKIACAEPDGLNYLFKTIFNILITVQAALFAFALRNKLRR